MAKKGKQKRRDRKKTEAIPGTKHWLDSVIAATAWRGSPLIVPFTIGNLGSSEGQQQNMEKEQAEKLEQAKAAEAAIAFQIQAQVDMWKTEVEGGNHLIGMMLSEVHPKIVTYEVEREGKLLPLPAFTWADPEKAQEDEELRAQAVKMHAEATGTSEEILLALLEIAKRSSGVTAQEAMDAQDKKAHEWKMKAARAVGDTEKLAKLEAQKKDWADLERMILGQWRSVEQKGKSV